MSKSASGNATIQAPPATITIDIFTLVEGMEDGGFYFAKRAMESSNQTVFDQLMDAGWPKVISRESPENASRFLAGLVHEKTAKKAVATLKRFFSGMGPEQVSKLLMSHNETAAPALDWCIEPKKSRLAMRLLEEAKGLGVDIERRFMFKDYNGEYWDHFNRSLSSGVTSMLCRASNAKEHPELVQSLCGILKLGKAFDQESAAMLMTRMSMDTALILMKSLRANSIFIADDILQSTKRLKGIQPDVLAMVQSCAAQEAIDRVISPSRKPGR